jgi:hypothetical protein
MNYWRKHTSNNTSSSILTTPTLTGTNSCAIHRSFHCPLIHRSFNCSLLSLVASISSSIIPLIHCLHHPSLLQLLPPHPSLAASIAPSITPDRSLVAYIASCIFYISLVTYIASCIFYYTYIPFRMPPSLPEPVAHVYYIIYSCRIFSCCSCLSIAPLCTPCGIYRSFPDPSLIYSIIPSLVSIFISLNMHNTIYVRWAPKIFANKFNYIVNL